MGRKMAPIADTGPIGQFAQRLRDRRDAAVPRPTFREMAEADTYYSHSVFAEACAGMKLPTEAVVEAFVTALGSDAEEVLRWKNDRLQVARMVGHLRRKLGDADVVVPTHTPEGKPIKPGRLRPVELELAPPDACVPKPYAARTIEDIIYELRVLRIAVGNPSLRVLAMHMTRQDFFGGLGVSTLSDLFSGKRSPTSETFETAVRGLLSYGRNRGLLRETGHERPAWYSAEQWLAAWQRAEFNRVRPDRMRRTANNVFLMSEDQDVSPTISVFAAMKPPVAAGLLIGMTPEESARVFEELPPEKSRELIREMEKLAGKATVDAEGAITSADIKRIGNGLNGAGTVVAMTSPRRRPADHG
ncbi:hypothetical protein [Amycolatopsis sp. cg9]|uniref:hypothetical protein n=1 Tax=Amycolatopsis sp. cg9 TaxID=3238801 RepID=UPI00352593CC